jgi:hypothetical protein
VHTKDFSIVEDTQDEKKKKWYHSY